MANLTFAIIKPDAVRAGNTGSIIQRINDSGFKMRALKLLHLTLKQAEGFYEVHRERPFFPGLTEFMSSGPIRRKLMRARCEKNSVLPSARMRPTAPTRMRMRRSRLRTSLVGLRLFENMDCAWFLVYGKRICSWFLVLSSW